MRHYFIVHFHKRAADVQLAPFICEYDLGTVACEIEDRLGAGEVRWTAVSTRRVIFRRNGSTVAVALRHDFQPVGAFTEEGV